jgi:hypothetical protein
MSMQKKKFDKAELLNIHDSGVLSRDQLHAFLYASWHYLTRRSKDRRGGHAEVDHKTGLPLSGNSLLPNHRALRGRDLALSTIMPPKAFVTSILRTDEIPENDGIAGDATDREFRCLALVAPDTWSEDTVVAVDVNTSRFNRLLSELEALGEVDTKPRIDDTGNTLGTTTLEHGDNGNTMGFRPTNKGLDAADEFVREHQFFSRHLHLDEWLGHSMAQQIPEWKQAADRDEVKA